MCTGLNTDMHLNWECERWEVWVQAAFIQEVGNSFEQYVLSSIVLAWTVVHLGAHFDTQLTHMKL